MGRHGWTNGGGRMKKIKRIIYYVFIIPVFPLVLLGYWASYDGFTLKEAARKLWEDCKREAQ
jgi:hypothetical protein